MGKQNTSHIERVARGWRIRLLLEQSSCPMSHHVWERAMFNWDRLHVIFGSELVFSWPSLMPVGLGVAKPGFGPFGVVTHPAEGEECRSTC